MELETTSIIVSGSKSNESTRSNIQESIPIISKSGTIEQHILDFVYSYGYDCRQNSNLCLISPNVLVFHSGNLIHFFDMTIKCVSTRRSAYGGGIGHITKNPNPEYNYLTVAENGCKPPIIIYQWPEMIIVSVCRNGTLRSYSYVDYTADGETMISQGCDPDYMITVWDWKNQHVILKCKSFQSEVFSAKFSIYDYGQLATCGQNHIKFWKISQTFTGLKMIGRHGRFGKTEISDIQTTFIMPGDQVLSGSTWGNVLVWDDAYIRVEVCRKNRRTCHDGTITQIYPSTNKNEIITIGLDGYVRVWFWETVDLANPPDTDPFVEIEPLFEYRIGSDAHLTSLMTLIRTEQNSNWWIAQDQNGGIWNCDLSPKDELQPSEMLFRCHAGPVIGIGCCPFASIIATLGEDGRLYVYNYLAKRLEFFRQFPAGGRSLIWLQPTIDPSGSVLFLGFSDGTVKIIVISISDPLNGSSERIKLIQVQKPHSKAITKLSINDRQTVLVSGSEDKTIFINQIVKGRPFVRIAPIGFIEIPSAVSCFTWKPHMYATLLIGCWYGEILELDVPEVAKHHKSETYKLEYIHAKGLVFKSVKSQIRRELQIHEIAGKKESKRKRKLAELERIRKENPDVMIVEETFLEDSSSEEELEQIFIPKIPNRILWMQYTIDKTIWVSMAGYDAGYIYEYKFSKENPVRSTIIPNGDDIEIHSYLYFDNYLIFGMQDGSIRINKQRNDFRDLSDYWTLNMHANSNGIISAIILSYDEHYLFSIGNDGNIFQYKWNFEMDDVEPADVEDFAFEDVLEVLDITDSAYPSLEQQKQNENLKARQKIIDGKKRKVYEIIEKYYQEFQEIIKRNNNLIESQRFPHEIFELDDRISDSVQLSLDDLRQLEHRKVAFEMEKTKIRGEKVRECLLRSLDDLPVCVSGIRSNVTVKTFRCRKLCDAFHEYQQYAHARIKNELERRRAIDIIEDNISLTLATTKTNYDIFMPEISETILELRLDLQFKRLLKKCRDRKFKEQEQNEKWQYILSIQPNPNKNDPNDDKEIVEAQESVGDYKLKSDPMYSPNTTEHENTSRKFVELLRSRKETDRLRNDYNRKVIELRNKKMDLINYIQHTKEKLKAIHEELPEELHQQLDENLLNLENPLNLTQVTDISSMERYEFKYYTIAKFKFEKIWENIINYLVHESHCDSKFEKELRQHRIHEKQFEQSQLLLDIDERVKQFDQELKEVGDSLMQIEVDAKFLDLFILQQNQELWILKDFEHLEEGLLEKIDQCVVSKNDIQSKLISNRNRIKQLNEIIGKLKEQEQTIFSQFLANCKSNKYFSFLKRIFHKKLKITTGSDSDESSSSSSDESPSEEESGDDNSHYSARAGQAYLDENICPAGCDQFLYEMAFELRSRRHSLERNKKEADGEIENIRSKNVILEKELRGVDAKLTVATHNLLEFTREKQQIINQIDAMIILKMDQLRYFRNDIEFMDIDHTLLFKNNVIRILYTRVGQLKIEAIEVQRKHRINVVHLARIRTDCKYMENRLAELHSKSQETIMKKFGMLLDLNELEETLLRNFLNTMNANVDHMQNEHKMKMGHLKKVFASHQADLKRVVQEGIEKLNILTVLQEDHNILSNMLIVQQKIKEKESESDDSIYEKDLNKLKKLSSHLDDQIANLEKEILILRLKAKPFNPITTLQLKNSTVTHDGQLHFTKNAPSTERSCSIPIGSPDMQYESIVKIVQSFLYDCLSGRIEMNDLLDPTYKITTRYIELIENYNRNQTEEINKNIFEKFKQIFSDNLLKSFPLNEIANLTNTILDQFDDTEINQDDLLIGLIDDIFEYTNMDPESEFYTEQILTKIITSICSNFQSQEAFSTNQLNQLIIILTKKDDLKFSNIDITQILESVLEHMQTELLEDFRLDQLNVFVAQLVKKLEDKSKN